MGVSKVYSLSTATWSALERVVATLTLIGVAACGPNIDMDRQAADLDLVAEVGEQIDATIAAESAIQIDTERKTIWIPAGGELDWVFKPLPGSSFESRDIVFRGGELRFEIDLEADEHGVANLITLDRSRPSLSLPIDLPDDPPIRLLLRVRPVDRGNGGGVLIRQPEIWSRQSEAPSADRSGAEAPLPARELPRPNVLIYLIDTLRSDRLGSYGNKREVSPHIDAFAEKATLFEHVVSQSSWTKASVGSIFTGVWPPRHGAVGWKHVLAEEFTTLAEILADAGYQTAGLSANPNIVPAYGMDQGFDTFHRRLRSSSGQFNEMSVEWLDQRDPSRPFFLYIHTIEPHAPYQPEEPFRQRLAPDADQMPSWQPSWKWPVEALPYLLNLYDAEIAANDASFGSLMAELDKRDLYDDTLIVLISDHGEEFKEHGRWRHGATLYAESLEIPMLIRLPGQTTGHRVEGPVQHVDVMPTILDRLGLEVPEIVEGRSLLGVATDPSRAEEMEPSRIFLHLKLGKSPLIHGLMDGDWKLLRSQSEQGTRVELFNWREDRGEIEDRAHDYPVRVEWMSRVIDRKLAESEAPPPTEEAVIDAETEEALEALGYLE